MDQLFVGKGVHERRDHRGDHRAPHDGQHTLKAEHGNAQNSDAVAFFDNLQLQEHVAAAHGVDGLQVGGVDGVKGEVDAADLQKRHAGQPFVRQKQAHQRAGHRRQPRHQRQHQEAGGHDGAAHGLLHPFQIVLLLGQDRQHHALDGAVHRVHQKLRELLAPVEIAQRLRGKLLADDKGTQVLVARIHQAGQQQLPAEGEQAPHPAEGKAEMRPPAHQNEQKDAQAELIGQLLTHQRPHAQPPQRHADAYAAGQHRSGQTGGHQLAEGHFSGNNCVLYAGQRPGEQDQRQHPQVTCQPDHSEIALDGGRGEEQRRIE